MMVYNGAIYPLPQTILALGLSLAACGESGTTTLATPAVEAAAPRGHDAGAQFDDRKHWVRGAGNRVYPEQRLVRADEIEVGLRIEENGGGAGQ